MVAVQLCNGMGVDSAAIITELIENPASRTLLAPDGDGGVREVTFDLADVDVVTAMTGDEYDQTRQVMEEHLLPRMRQARLRYVQIARAGRSETDGVVVLDDTDQPTTMHMRGPWRLSDELRLAGTIPQSAGAARKCSYRAKGFPLDRWAAAEYGGAERISIIGFAAEEKWRAERDTSYSKGGRRAVYPLMQWRRPDGTVGWDRDYCLAYLRDRYGITWPRSCCAYCPFAGGSVAKNAAIAQRWAQDTDAAVLALELELVALALNPRMKLFKRHSAHDVAVTHDLQAALAAYEQALNGREWAVYEVRRVHLPKGWNRHSVGDLHVKGHTWRSTRIVRTGSRQDMCRLILRARDGRVEGNVTPRLWLREAQGLYPTAEHFAVAAPASAEEKSRDSFERIWRGTLAYQGKVGQLHA